MKTGIAVLTLTAILAASITTATIASDNAGARSHVMKSLGKSMKQLGQIAKGDAASYNANDAKTLLAKIASDAGDFLKYYPAGSESDSTDSLPAIWKNFDDFKGRAAGLAADANTAIASADSFDALKPALAKMASDCKSCHETYRAPD